MEESTPNLPARLAAPFLAERERWLLWAPVALGAGAGFYFGLRAEPPVWAAPLALGLALFALLLSRPEGRAPAWGLVLLALGFGAAQLRANLVAHPLLTWPHGPDRLEGVVADLDIRPDGVRVVLEDLRIERWSRGVPPPERARVRLTRRSETPPVGARVALRAELSPPPGPSLPGGYDYQRQAWFQQLGAVGYAVSRVEIQDAPPPAPLEQRLEALRQALAARLSARLPADEAAIATALLTGERGHIDPALLEDVRRAGLAHLLAISGLHVGLVAGIVFFVLRALMAAFPPLALKWPIKKMAALGALLATLGYTLLVGAPVPTQRAMLMTGLVLLAVMLDRRAISMRLVALAAMAVLLARPEAVTGPSFQMSFAAVVGLVATYGALRGRLAGWRAAAGPFARVGLFLGSLALTSLVAGAATAPYALYHFNRVALYGVLANMAAVPLTASWIMPMGVAVMVTAPLGLDLPFSWAMGKGVALLEAIAHATAAQPGAELDLAAMPLPALIIITLGGLWLALWRRRWRWAGLAPIALGMVMIALAPRPDILVAAEGGLVAFAGDDGSLALSTRQRGRFTAEVWREHLGRPAPATLADALDCDAAGCVWRKHGQVVTLNRDPGSLAEDCALSALVISPESDNGLCPPGARIDRANLRREGAHAVWLRSGLPPRIESVRDRRGWRPWTVY